jgi:PAS domain S-box-containing protein
MRDDITLLLVEDEQAILDELQSILSIFYSNIYTARDGNEGLEVFNNQSIDIVITDIRMPHSDGLALSENIRNISPNTPVIILSAHNDTQYLVDAINKGVTHYLFKPIDVDLLLNHLKKLVNTIEGERSLLSTQSLLEQYKEAVDESSIFSKTDPRGIITYVNENFCTISGFTKEELIGKSHSIIRNPDEPKAKFTDLWSTITQKKIWKNTLSNRRKDGTIYHVETTIIPVLDLQGEVREYLSIRYDISKQIEQKDQLEHILLDLKQSNKVKDLFLGSMSHNLKTPLNGILGFAQILESRQSLEPNVQKYMRQIINSSNFLLNQITTMLHFTTIESRHITLSTRLVSTKTIRHELTQQLGYRLRIKDITLTFEGEETDFYADEELLQLMLLNIISNAVEVSPMHGKIVLSCENSLGFMTFTIEEQATLLSSTKVQHVLQNFTNSEDFTYKLALSTAQSIAKAHNGHINIDTSELLGGNRITIYLQS